MEMLNTQCYDWEKPNISKRLLARTLGQGLVNVEGNKHKAMRRVVAPAFSGKHIRDLVPLFYAKGLAFVDAMAREAKQNTDGTLEMMGQMSRVTLDIIGAAGIGKDFNTIENDEDVLARLYETITTDPRNGNLVLALLIAMYLPGWVARRLKGTIYARRANAQKQLRHEVRALIQEKKQSMIEKSDDQKDIIAIIMRSGEYPDDYLVDQLLTFLAAG
jgi:cytochrome P450